MALAYRKDIDGLRAVAIVPVVLYHSGLPGFPGGFVGVDVFFVISGFLIAGIIHREIEAGVFTIAGFYERRARRILPALFFVLAASAIAAFALLGPADFTRFATAVAATTLFVSNVYFWLTTDYFATAAEFRPLLHTWSLAVEEQFYVGFPLLMIAMASWRMVTRRTVFVAALALSFIVSVIATPVSPSASFYLIVTRAWELLLGVCLALNVVPPPSGRLVRSFAAAAGLVLIAVAVFTFSSTTPFPGAAALLPAGGAALIIYAGSGGETAVGRMLSVRPMVWIGLISYSLYLWHWPVLGFIRIAQGSVLLDHGLGIAAIAASVLAATISYRYVEQPFRKGRIGTRRIFGFSAAGSSFFLILSAAVHVSDGAPFRFDHRTIGIMEAANDIEPNRLDCQDRFPKDGLCRAGLAAATPSIVVWGDSHVGAIMSAVDRIAAENGKASLLAYHAACAPLLGVRRQGEGARSQSCVDFNEAVFRHIEENSADIDTVILIGRWALNATSARAPGEPGPPVYLAKKTGEAGQNSEMFKLGLENTVRQLDDLGVRTIILGGVPEIGWNVPRRLATFSRFGLRAADGPAYSDVEERNAVANRLLSETAERFGAEYIPIAPMFCASTCAVIDGDRPLYVDDDHLSVHGAVNVLAPGLSTILKP